MVLGSKLIILTLVVLFAVCSNVEARCSYGCNAYCSWQYDGNGWRRVCSLRCGVKCRWGKRSLTQDEKNRIIPFPERFLDYDINKDGKITLEELAKATNIEEHSVGTEKAFKEADRNQDGGIDCDEFKTAPYLFKHQPTCQ